MSITRRNALTLLASLPASFALPWSTAFAEEGGNLVVGLRTSEPRHLNPAVTTVGGVQLVSANIYSALTRFDRDGHPVPDLAKSWDISPDGLTYTFNLVPNVKWHDGQPFSSADVKFSFEQVLLPLHPVGKINFAAIDRIDTPDVNTVVFRLKYPYAPFISLLEVRHATILPKHIYENTDVMQNPANSQPIGTGPFKLAEWSKGSFLRLEKNADYFKPGKPHLDQLVFVIIPDTNTMVAAMEANQIDFAPLGVSFDLVETLKQRLAPKGWVIGTAQYLFRGTGSLIINTGDPILAKREVRQALAMLVQKDAILSTVRKGVGRIAENPISWYVPNAETDTIYKPDLEKAEGLLDAAGFPRGAGGKRFGLSIVVSTGWAEFEPIANLLRDWLGKAGIDLDLQKVDEAAAVDRMFTTRNFQLGLSNPSFGPDPAIMAKGFTTDQIGKGAYTNGMGYSNPTVDKLFAEGVREIDPAARHGIYRKIVDAVMTDVPVIPLYEDDFAYAFRSVFKGLPPGGTHRDSYEDVSSVG
ncbi:peptide/nickel transport system substrate-binding protein [Faunimonas pinastri]|uniref:Peptide/nickel transport system substrate-binding protein n=1 Tax=Faunimonas pinastri TaxID=1855383 RepID=A0A1H9DYW4_9HYPH|nr:ABC transporter substrate-binding protein [Faunimonas pinastri]SEQ18093.1 peptide/nickel transport system substrate-binding protein [Faunimonas pinastri]